MNEEELRAEVTRLTNENKDLEDKYITVSEQIKVKDDEITSLNNSVSNLKQKNYDLFIQVSTPVETKPVETKPTEKTTSIADVVSKMIGGK